MRLSTNALSVTEIDNQSVADDLQSSSACRFPSTHRSERQSYPSALSDLHVSSAHGPARGEIHSMKRTDCVDVGLASITGVIHSPT